MKKEVIFIDTSVFLKENFFNSKAIREILKMGNKSFVQIIIPIIIYNEVLKNYKSRLNIAIKELDNIRSKIMVLKNDEELEIRTHRIMKSNTIERFHETLEREINSAKVIIIQYSEMNIEYIFNDYFDNNFPFGSSDKKHEFPDAFALKMIEKWCKEKGKTCTIISNDKDMLNYTSERIEKSESLSDFLDRKNKEIQESRNEMDVISMIDESFKTDQENIKSEIRSWTNLQLDDYTKYIDFVNGLEIHDVDIEKIEVETGDIGIISIEDTHVTLGLEAKIKYVVTLWIDDENYMIKDYDNKSWFYLEQKEEVIQGSKEIDVELEYEYDENPEFAGDIKVSVINNGNKLII